jgi:hypothetical protein
VGTGLDMLVLFQTVVSAVSVYFLARIAYLIRPSMTLFRVVFFGYAISTYVSIYDKYILAESLCIASLIFSFYFFAKYTRTPLPRHLLWTGVMAAISVFLRPAVLVIYPALAAGLLLGRRWSPTMLVKQMLLLFIPLAVAEGYWITRNYRLHRSFIPFTSNRFYDQMNGGHYYPALMDFVMAWGGDAVYWNPGAEIRWFGDGRKSEPDTAVKLPERIYTSAYNIDTLNVLRGEMSAFKQSGDTLLLGRIKSKLLRYTSAYKAEKPLAYRVVPLFIAGKFILNGGGTFILFSRTFGELRVPEKALKLFMILLYEIVAIGGVVCSLVMLVRRRQGTDVLAICAFIPLTILLITFGYRLSEYRYFAPAYPFCLCLVAYVCHYSLMSGKFPRRIIAKFEP